MNPPLNETIMSTTLIKLYLNCPNACKLKYVDKHTASDKNNWMFKAGKSGHKIFEHFYERLDLNAPDTQKEFTEKLKAVAFQYWDRSIDSRKREEIESNIFTWLKYEMQRFENCKKQGCIDRFKPIEVEQDLTDYIGKKRAVIDKRCLGISGIRYVIDYKFDSTLPALRNYKNILSEIDIEYKVQAAMNAMVLKSHGHDIDAFYFQFIKNPDKLLSIPLIPQLFNEVENIITKIRLDTEFKKNPKNCGFCAFRMVCNLKEISINCL